MTQHTNSDSLEALLLRGYGKPSDSRIAASWSYIGNAHYWTDEETIVVFQGAKHEGDSASYLKNLRPPGFELRK